MFSCFFPLHGSVLLGDNLYLLWLQGSTSRPVSEYYHQTDFCAGLSVVTARVPDLLSWSVMSKIKN